MCFSLAPGLVYTRRNQSYTATPEHYPRNQCLLALSTNEPFFGGKKQEERERGWNHAMPCRPPDVHLSMLTKVY